MTTLISTIKYKFIQKYLVPPVRRVMSTNHKDIGKLYFPLVFAPNRVHMRWSQLYEEHGISYSANRYDINHIFTRWKTPNAGEQAWHALQGNKQHTSFDKVNEWWMEAFGNSNVPSWYYETHPFRDPSAIHLLNILHWDRPPTYSPTVEYTLNNFYKRHDIVRPMPTQATMLRFPTGDNGLHELPTEFSQFYTSMQREKPYKKLESWILNDPAHYSSWRHNCRTEYNRKVFAWTDYYHLQKLDATKHDTTFLYNEDAMLPIFIMNFFLAKFHIFRFNWEPFGIKNMLFHTQWRPQLFIFDLIELIILGLLVIAAHLFQLQRYNFIVLPAMFIPLTYCLGVIFVGLNVMKLLLQFVTRRFFGHYVYFVNFITVLLLSSRMHAVVVFTWLKKYILRWIVYWKRPL